MKKVIERIRSELNREYRLKFIIVGFLLGGAIYELLEKLIGN